MAYDGMSCHKIATQLNAEKVPSPATYAGLTIGNPGPYTGLWSSERISDMLNNEMYIGNMVQGRMVKISYKSKKCLRQAPDRWIVVEGTHEPIIDEDLEQEVFDLSLILITYQLQVLVYHMQHQIFLMLQFQFVFLNPASFYYHFLWHLVYVYLSRY